MKGKKILIPVLLLITLIAIGVTIWALCFRDTAPVLAPDYAPVEEESNAQAIEDDSDEKLEAEEGGGAVSLTYSNAWSPSTCPIKRPALFLPIPASRCRIWWCRSSSTIR